MRVGVTSYDAGLLFASQVMSSWAQLSFVEPCFTATHRVIEGDVKWSFSTWVCWVY